jgi:long-chain fatty acid transport protein
VDTAVSGAYEVPGFGAKAMSLGGAFVGRADDWTASFYNPAGLTQLKGRSIGITLFNINWNGADRDSIANRDPQALQDKKLSIRRGDIFPRLYPSEPLQFSKKEIRHRFYQPSIGGYFHWDEYTISLATYNPLGNFLHWRDIVIDPATQAQILASYYTRFFMAVSNLSVARKITPKLSLGAGINLIYSQFELDAYKRYQNVDPKLSSFDYYLDIEENGKGIGWEGVVGVLYQINPKISIGGVYRSGSIVRMRGGAHIYQQIGKQVIIAEGSDYLRKFPQPPTWGIGLAYTPIPQLTLSADWHCTDWRVQKYHVSYKHPGENLPNTNINLHWKVSSRYRFGIEYRVLPKISLRAGFYYDERGMPGEFLGFTTVPTVDRKEASFGMSYDLGKWLLEASYNAAWGHQNIHGAEQVLWNNMLHFSLAYRF